MLTSRSKKRYASRQTGEQEQWGRKLPLPFTARFGVVWHIRRTWRLVWIVTGPDRQ